MTSLLVTATQESSGKTAIALALATLARDRGRSVGYMKPKGTRLESVVGKTLDTDPMLAADLLDLDDDVADLEPIVYSPTFVEGVMRGREDPEALRTVGSLGAALVETQKESDRGETPQRGFFGLLGALRDPDVQHAIGFLTTFAKRFGQNLRS